MRHIYSLSSRGSVTMSGEEQEEPEEQDQGSKETKPPVTNMADTFEKNKNDGSVCTREISTMSCSALSTAKIQNGASDEHVSHVKSMVWSSSVGVKT